MCVGGGGCGCVCMMRRLYYAYFSIYCPANVTNISLSNYCVTQSDNANYITGKSMIKYNDSNGSSASTTSTGSNAGTSSCASVSNSSSASTGSTVINRGCLK